MSSDRRPNKIASILRLPLVSKNLAGTLRQPTYMAIAASLGLHGVVGVGFALVSPNGLGDSQLATRIVETNLVELTPEEISRLPVVSTLPVGRLPAANSNALSAGTLPSLSGLPRSSSENSSLEVPPGFVPPLGYSSSESTDGMGSYLNPRASNDFSSVERDDLRGSNVFSGGLSPEELQDLIDRASISLGHRPARSTEPEADDSEFDPTNLQPQGKDKRKQLPDAENEEDSETDNLGTEDETIGSTDSPNDPDSEAPIYYVLGGLPAIVPLETVRGEYPVAVQVDADGQIVGWELLADSDNPFLIKTIEQNFALGFPSTGREEVYQFAVVFDDNSPRLNEGGSEQEELLQIVASSDSESETAPNAEPQILALDPISYSIADLSLSPEELSKLSGEAIVDIVITPDGAADPQLVLSTGNDRLDAIALERARAWVEQKFAPDSPTPRLTIPFELIELDGNIETPPQTPTPEETEETIEEKPIPPQTPAPEPLEPEQPDLEVIEPEVPEPEVPQEKIPPSSPTPTPGEKRPPQAPSEPDTRSEGLPELPPEGPTQPSPPEAPLPIEKEPLSNSSKATKIKP